MDAAQRSDEPTVGYERLADRLASASSEGFVGRQRELGLLSRWVDADGVPSVVVVHGPPGIGKTALVRRFAVVRGADTVVLDGHAVEPTPTSVLTALGGAVGADADVDEISAAMAGTRRCLVIDGVERLVLVDSWLRTELLPAMPASLTTVLAGRQRPNVAWLTAPGWQGLVAEVAVGPLDTTEAGELLAALGVEGDAAQEAQRFARGHPLALRLAAAVPGAAGGVPGAAPVAVEHLVDRFLDGLPSADVRLVHAATTTRRVLAGDLEAILGDDGPDGGPDAWWRRLRDLPFAEVGADGLELHELVRDAVQLSLARRDPDQHARLRARAVRVVSERVARSTPAWSTTADVLYLARDPVIRDGFFPPTGDLLPVEDARPSDRPAIDELVERHEGADSARHIRAWLDAHPGSIRVARADDGSPLAFQSTIELSDADPRVLRRDPVAARWAQHIDRDPLPPDGLALLIRRALGEAGHESTPSTASLFVDVKRTYMELRPRLRRVYLETTNPEPSLLEHLGFVEVTRVELDGDLHRVLVLDFGPRSVDGWLAGLVEAELDEPGSLGTAEDPPGTSPLDALTPRELEVLALVAQGATNKDVASALGISLKTVGRHLENLFVKLGVGNRAAATRVATRHGLVG